MTGDQGSSTATSPAVQVNGRARFPLGRNELGLIVAFWSFMAVLTAANRLLGPRGIATSEAVAWQSVLLAFAEAYSWAVVTPLVFELAQRLPIDRASPPRRIAHMALLVAAGFLIAVAIATVANFVRRAVFPPPPQLTRRPRPSEWSIISIWVMNDFFIYLGVLAAGFARFYSMRFRARQEETARVQAEAAQLRATLQAQLAEARLDALRMQLDPHFLFNTLNAISSLVERDPRGVRRMISRLGELLRHSIEGSSEPEIPLREELDLLQRYLDIMQVRFQGKLSVSLDIDEEARDALVPNLVLQPLVENAIKHGTSKIGDQGRIEISAHLVDGGSRLLLSVRDNGPGGGAERSAFHPQDGVGLRNTRARLDQLYGDSGRFVLARRPPPEEGVVAEVELPFHTADDLRVAAVSVAP